MKIHMEHNSKNIILQCAIFCVILQLIFGIIAFYQSGTAMVLKAGETVLWAKYVHFLWGALETLCKELN